MSNLEKRINDLIDRAVHATTNENEARNCALQACKLIRQHAYRLTKRAELPGIDVSPDKVWDETVELAKKDAAQRLEDMAETMFGGRFNPLDWIGEKEETKKGVGYIQRRASCRYVCGNCNAEIRPGAPILEEFGQNAQKGSRRVTCLKDRCRASWTRR